MMRAPLLIALALGMLLWGCSPAPVAGGSGAGNPGAVAVAIVADTGYVSQPLLKAADGDGPTLPLTDDGALSLTASTMR
jgi:hypothetical protein